MIEKDKKQSIIEEYKTHEADTGSTEVQVYPFAIFYIFVLFF